MLFQLDFEILKFLHFGINFQNFQIPEDVTLFKEISSFRFVMNLTEILLINIIVEISKSYCPNF